ncbi:MAG: DUF6340 family protein [Flavobacteriales bacterium]
MHFIKITTLYFVVAVSLFSCVATSSTELQVMKPAEISVSPQIMKLGVVDRSHPDKKGKALNILEGLTSGEAIYQDKNSSLEAIGGLVSGLSKSQRFTIFQIQGLDLTNNGSSYFSPLLDWNLVREICIKNNVDALVVLEIFDTDKNMRLSNETRTITRNGISQNEIWQVVHSTITVTTGWRIYDPANQTVLDEFRFNDSKTNTGKGLTTVEAENSLSQGPSTVYQLARANGEKYALRIAPTPILVYRSYYTGGDIRLKEARNLIINKSYQEALTVYKQVSENAEKPKVKARAAHNVAMVYEVLGDIDLAIEWVQKAISMGNKSSRHYLAVLQQRKTDDAKAKEQMIELK